MHQVAFISFSEQWTFYVMLLEWKQAIVNCEVHQRFVFCIVLELFIGVLFHSSPDKKKISRYQLQKCFATCSILRDRAEKHFKWNMVAAAFSSRSYFCHWMKGTSFCPLPINESSCCCSLFLKEYILGLWIIHREIIMKGKTRKKNGHFINFY